MRIFIFFLSTIFFIVSVGFSEESLSTKVEKDDMPILLLEPMVVIGKKTERDPIKEPHTEIRSLSISSSVITALDIRLQNAKTVTESLYHSVGSVTESRGRKVKQFTSFRGQKYPYPVFAINGMWQREFHEVPYFFPTAMIERIEVIRSSATLLMGGADGLTGAINIIPYHFESSVTYGNIEYGSYGSHEINFYHTHQFKNKNSCSLSGGYTASPGPSNKNASERMLHLGATAGLKLTNVLAMDVNAFLLSGQRELARAEDPARVNLQLTNEQYDPYRAVHSSIRLRYLPIARYSTELMISITDRNHDFHSSTTGVHVSNSEEDYEFATSLTQALGFGKSNLMRIGVLFNNWVAPQGKRFYAGRRTDLDSWSAVIVDEHDFGKLSLDAGLRYMRTKLNEFSVYATGGSIPKNIRSVPAVNDVWDKPVLSGSFGLNYECSETSLLSINFSFGSLKPRTGSLTADLVEPETEKRNMLELGLSKNLSLGGKTSLSVFSMIRKNAIIYSSAAPFILADGSEQEYSENQDMRQYGIEFDLRTPTILNMFRLIANTSLMQNKIKAGNAYEDYTKLPSHTFNFGCEFGKGRVDLNLYAKYVSDFKNTRFAATGTGEHPLGEYLKIDFSGGYTFGSKKLTRVYVDLRNLTDKKFSTAVGYPDWGFRSSIGVETKL